MSFGDLFAKPGAWLGSSCHCGIVVSSRIRLARNLAERRFPGWAPAAARRQVWAELREVLLRTPTLDQAYAAAIEELSELEQRILFERHLISRELMERRGGGGLVVRPTEDVAVMVNEEDHLRLQAIRPGLDLKGAWDLADCLDDEIESQVHYAFSSRWGYLTACPTNAGTGLRASVMLHLPGLALARELKAVINGLQRLGLAVRGLWGEGTEATGEVFQVSNQATLGEPEGDLVKRLNQIVGEVVEHERQARQRLLENRPILLRDQVGRALGILSKAHLLTSSEAFQLLSGLRLGVELGIVTGIARQAVDDLLIQAQPAHMQRALGRALDPSERDAARARLVRERLTGVEPVMESESR